MASNEQLCNCIRGCHDLMSEEDLAFNQRYFDSLQPQEKSVFLKHRIQDKHHIWCPSANDYMSICEKALKICLLSVI